MSEGNVINDRLTWKLPAKLAFDYALRWMVEQEIMPEPSRFGADKEISYAVSYENVEERTGLVIEFYIRAKGKTIEEIESADKEVDRKARKILLGYDPYTTPEEGGS